MTMEEIKSELAQYKSKLDSINDQLGKLDEQKNKILQSGFQIQGIVAFLSQKLKDMEEAAAAMGKAEKLD